MVIDINNTAKYIDIWLGHGDAPPDIKAYRERYPGYSIAVFHSGGGDLKSLTATLLKSNMESSYA